MNYFGLMFMLAIGIGFMKSMKEMKSEKERLRIKLGIAKDDPSNESLESYLMVNRFQFLMILFMIFLVGSNIIFFLSGEW